MLLPLRITDAELDANRHIIASAIAGHPLYLQFTSTACAVLSAIATGEAPMPAAAERRFLRRALLAIDAAEVEISRRLA